MSNNSNTGTKGRFDGLDVQAMVAYLQGWCAGRRVVNIYDGASGESYVFKLEKADVPGSGSGARTTGNSSSSNNGSKEFLLLESGIRFHTISSFAADAMPTPFCAKLRKHVRGLRLEQITQIGEDRVVMFQFGSGASKCSIILELYAKGNLILTDHSYTALALLRSHVYNTANGETTPHDSSAQKPGTGEYNTDVQVRVGQVYPVSYATSLSTTSDDVTAPAVTTAIELDSASAFHAWALQHVQAARLAAATVDTKKKKSKQSLTLKTLLAQHADSGVMHYGPALVEHCIRTAQLDPNRNLLLLLGAEPSTSASNQETTTTQCEWSHDEWLRLRHALQTEGPRVLQSLHNSESSSGGFVLYRLRDESTSTTPPMPLPPLNVDCLPHADKMFQEFLPVLLKQHEGRLYVEYDTFVAAVEDYYDHLSHQKNMLKAASAERAAVTRLEKVKTDQQDRIDMLGKQQEILEQQAATVQLHADSVDKALAVINSAIDSGMDWNQLEQIVTIEQTQNRNPIALLIHKLDLEHDAMILRLPTMSKDLAADDDDGKTVLETIDVLISLKESAYANANRLFAKYRSSKEKSTKTIEASAKALKAAEEVAKRQLSEAQKRAKQSGATVPGGIRKTSWFEKFHWFVTSDNYLVLGGKDAHQNEQLVKRYLRPGDAYLHADVHGAATCILRAKRRRRVNGEGTEVLPLSEQSLREAGKFTICRSSAWSSRMVTSAWWVESHQVSKTAPSGEYLTVGSFMIRGKKTYLPPTPLEMGLAIMFKLGDDDSILRHKNERRDFALLENDEEDVANISPPAFEGILSEPHEQDTDPGETNVIEDDDDDDSIIQKSVPTNTSVIVDDGVNDSDPTDDDEIGDPISNGDESDDDSTRDGEQSDPEIPAEDTEVRKKKGLSVRDRKLIKKYGSLQAAEAALGSISESNGKAITTQVPEKVPVVLKTQTPASRRQRGQKSKQKKVERKYFDQDEEDRALAMLALQGGEKSKATKGDKNREKRKVDVSENQQKAADETIALLVKDTSLVAAQFPESVYSILAECVTIGALSEEPIVRWDKFDAETLQQMLALDPVEAQVAAATRLLALKQTTRIDNFSSSLGGIIRTVRKHGYSELNKDVGADEQSKRKTKTEKAHEASKWRQTLEEEGLVDSDLEEDAVDDTTELLKLTGKPTAEDLLVFAIPVCGPYSTLSQYSYRVKLTPGSMKRGKAAKQCTELLLKSTSNSIVGVSRQLDLIKRVADMDWVQVMCADVKIAAAGAAKTTKTGKSVNKKKGK